MTYTGNAILDNIIDGFTAAQLREFAAMKEAANKALLVEVEEQITYVPELCGYFKASQMRHAAKRNVKILH